VTRLIILADDISTISVISGACSGLLFALHGAKRRFMYKPALIPYLCFGFCVLAAAQSMQKAPSDSAKEAAIVEHLGIRVHYENDGTGFVENSSAIRIQSEAGIQRYGQLLFGYSSATEKLDIDYVRVRKPDGQVVETSAATAQDLAPEILRSAPMYSDFRQRHVTVSGLRPGDVLEYHTTTHIVSALAPGEFWYEYNFPRHISVTEARLEIDVPKSREIKLKSPKRKYTSADSGDRRTYTWVVQNIVPERKDNEEEDDESAEDEDDFPDVQLTTFHDWQQIAHWYAKLQGERVLLDDSIKKKAAELTRGASSSQEKAQRLYDFVARDIRYVSLSFGVGRYQPHAAPEVMQGSYGDCKDKHTLLSALLRAAGIPSYPVLIDSERKLDEDIPSPAQFDHVITIAQIDKEWVWLDSTAEIAPFGLILYPLRDKQAVVAAEDANGGLRKTPALSPVKNTLAFTMQGKVLETGALDGTIEITANGDSAVPMRMLFRMTPQADWQDLGERLSFFQGYQGKVSDLDVSGLEEPAKPFRLRYKLHQDTYFAVPSTGVTLYPFPPMGLGRLPKKKRNEPLDLGPAVEMVGKAHLEFASNYALRLPPDVSITRDYGQYTLTYHLANNVLDAERSYIAKVSQLPASRRTDVESLRSVATSYAGQSITCEVRPASKAALAATVPMEGTPQELRKAGVKALEKRDFKNASELLKRVVAQQPDSADAWDELGRAYTGLSNHNDAVAAYRKQVEVNPFHKRAYNDLGAELQLEGKYEEALAAYGKQLDNDPVDSGARKHHGLLLARLKRSQDALKELETASTASPDDPEIELALAQLYVAGGNQEKSQSLFKSVIGSTSLPASDWFGAALGDSIDPDQTLSDARKIVETIGDQFDSGDYDRDSPEVFSAMYYLALEWARIGWAHFLKGERLEGIRYLDSAWSLSQNGAVAARLARIYEKAGDTAKAKHLQLLAGAASGASSSTGAPALPELAQLRSVKMPSVTQKKGQAEFTLVFDGSGRPQRVDFHSGDEELRGAEQTLLDADYPVLFPEYTSAKIVRRAVLSCGANGCLVTLKLLEQPKTLGN